MMLHMATEPHTVEYSTHEVEEMMRVVFGGCHAIPALDVRPAIRALQAQLRGRSNIASRRRAARRLGQANPHALTMRIMRITQSASRGHALHRLLGVDGSASELYIAPRQQAAHRDDAVAARIEIPAADLAARKARDHALARDRAVSYVHHFPARAAQARSIAAK